MSVPQYIAGYLEDYLDGSLDKEGHAILAAWSSESDTNGEAIAAWFVNEVQLLEATRVAAMQEVFQGLPFDPRPLESNQQPQSAARQYRRSHGQNVLIIAASVLVALGVAYFWPTSTARKTQTASLASGRSHQSPGHAVSPAMLGRLADCVWGTDTKPLRVGQDIAAGTLIDIKSGLAQLVFESGAEVVLAGPCRLQVDSSMMCRLYSGNVSAEVPHQAAGFTIRGPSAEVIDLGTRFGFSVGAGGNSEVHVFQGEVISRRLDEHGQVVGKEFRLKQNQAVLFPGEKKQAQRLAANEAKFALEVKPLWRQDKIEPLAVDRNMALWLRAEHGVLTDKKQNVIAWQDLAVTSDRVANDSFQSDPLARPQFVTDGIFGRPAIRFDGAASYLTTTPITTTDDQTIVAVFQYAQPLTDAERVGGQIVNYNGPPSRYLPDIRSPGVLQLGEKIDNWNGPITSIAAKAFVGRDSRGADISAGVTVSKPLGYSQPHVVAYVYGNTHNKALLFVDGTLAAESSAPTSVAVTSRKVIGKHGIFDQWYFRGDLSELLIYNAALRGPEVKNLSRRLMEHYGIPAAKDAAELAAARPVQ